MSETTAPKAAMFAAIAKLQADLPRIAKGETAKVTSDKGNYSYKYADLADVAAQVMPRLAKFGLGFIALPTLNEGGKFVLAYSLIHESGEREDGEYPLPTAGSPQQVGSAITYARRYTLCAVTGTTPDGDDDGQAAEQAYRHSGQQARGGDRQQGQVSRPARQESAAAEDAGHAAEADQDAQKYADTASQARTVADVAQIHKQAVEAGKIGAQVRAPESGKTGKLAVYLDWRRKQLADLDRAWKELDEAREAAGMDTVDLEVFVKQAAGRDADAASAAQLRQAAAKLRERAA